MGTCREGPRIEWRKESMESLAARAVQQSAEEEESLLLDGLSRLNANGERI